ncbi:MAG: hypothetical protein IJZ44_02110 [Lachnospiraceae bacterium]|nr:hypothetical protein [Lachnospiraceae bacterium]
MKTEKMVIQLVKLLTEMGVDTYTKCKCMIMSGCKDPATEFFFTELFARVDDRRPKLLEMK